MTPVLYEKYHEKWYILTEDYRFAFTLNELYEGRPDLCLRMVKATGIDANQPIEIVAPKGFVTDLASIPTIFHIVGLTPHRPVGRGGYAARFDVPEKEHNGGLSQRPTVAAYTAQQQRLRRPVVLDGDAQSRCEYADSQGDAPNGGNLRLGFLHRLQPRGLSTPSPTTSPLIRYGTTCSSVNPARRRLVSLGRTSRWLTCSSRISNALS